MVVNPIRMSATPLRYKAASPLLGQHTSEVLANAGIDANEIERLRAAGVI